MILNTGSPQDPLTMKDRDVLSVGKQPLARFLIHTQSGLVGFAGILGFQLTVPPRTRSRRGQLEFSFHLEKVHLSALDWRIKMG